MDSLHRYLNGMKSCFGQIKKERHIRKVLLARSMIKLKQRGATENVIKQRCCLMDVCMCVWSVCMLAINDIIAYPRWHLRWECSLIYEYYNHLCETHIHKRSLPRLNRFANVKKHIRIENEANSTTSAALLLCFPKESRRFSEPWAEMKTWLNWIVYNKCV